MYYWTLAEGFWALPWTCEVKVVQSCLTLCDPIDYMVHGILQARILEWVAFPFSRGSSQPRDQTQVSPIVGGFFTSWATREALSTRSECNCKIVWTFCGIAFLWDWNDNLPFPVLCHCCVCAMFSCSVVSNSAEPVDSSPPGSSVLGHSSDKKTGVGCHALLQGIFPTQGLNPGPLPCRRIFYHLSLQGSPSFLNLLLYWK